MNPTPLNIKTETMTKDPICGHKFTNQSYNVCNVWSPMQE